MRLIFAIVARSIGGFLAIQGLALFAVVATDLDNLARGTIIDFSELSDR